MPSYPSDIDPRKKRRRDQVAAAGATPTLTQTPSAESKMATTADARSMYGPSQNATMQPQRPLTPADVRRVAGDLALQRRQLERQAVFLRRLPNGGVMSSPEAMAAYGQVEQAGAQMGRDYRAAQSFFARERQLQSGPTQLQANPEDQRRLRELARVNTLRSRAPVVAETQALRGQIAGAREGYAIDRGAAGVTLAGQQRDTEAARASAARSKVEGATVGRERDIQLATADANRRIAEAQANLQEIQNRLGDAEAQRSPEFADAKLKLQQAQAAKEQADADLGRSGIGGVEAQTGQIKEETRRQKIANDIAERTGVSPGTGMDALDQQLKAAQVGKALESLKVPQGSLYTGDPEKDRAADESVRAAVDQVAKHMNTLPMKGGTIDFGAIPVQHLASLNEVAARIKADAASGNPPQVERAKSAAASFITAIDASAIPDNIEAAPSIWSMITAGFEGGGAMSPAILAGRANSPVNRAKAASLQTFNSNIAELRKIAGG